MLLNLHKKKWMDGLTLKAFEQHNKANVKVVQVGHAASVVDHNDKALTVIHQFR